MKGRILIAAIAFAAAAPAFGSAQERESAPERDVRESRPRVRMYTSNRVRLGVTVQTQADAESDRLGAKIVAVAEEGPAAAAGLKAGDIITRFGSTSLAGVKTESADSGRSGPGLRLVELAQKLDEGDSVVVQYRRDGAARTATVVARAMDDQFTFRRFEGPMVLPRMGEGGTFEFFGDGPESDFSMLDGPGNFSVFLGAQRGLQLVPLNTDLGEYFGTTEGLLVARASNDSAVPLRSGDVILSINGRKPTSVGHALRILGSYEEGEAVKAEVMRKRQRVNLEWTVRKPEIRRRTLSPSRTRDLRERDLRDRNIDRERARERAGERRDRTRM